jgi:hypothetical protein
MSVRAPFALLPVLFFSLVLSVTPTHATRVLPLNLEELTKHAGRVFSGRITEVRVERDPGLDRDVTRVTAEVEHSAKGGNGRSVTFRVLGRQNGKEPLQSGIGGMPRFREGEEVVLFLYGESKAGLTSPVGFGQGKFSLVRDKQGRRVALNESGNQTLFQGLSDDAEKRLGPASHRWKRERGIPLESLLGMVESLRR